VLRFEIVWIGSFPANSCTAQPNPITTRIRLTIGLFSSHAPGVPRRSTTGTASAVSMSSAAAVTARPSRGADQ
jgi:hypothetical protein